MKRIRSWFNTTKQPHPVAALEESNAQAQEQVVLELFQKKRTMSASQVYAHFDSASVPLTSVRRAMTVLKKRGHLDKTDVTVTGIYGKPECYYTLRVELN